MLPGDGGSLDEIPPTFVTKPVAVKFRRRPRHTNNTCCVCNDEDLNNKGWERRRDLVSEKAVTVSYTHLDVYKRQV